MKFENFSNLSDVIEALIKTTNLNNNGTAVLIGLSINSKQLNALYIQYTI